MKPISSSHLFQRVASFLLQNDTRPPTRGLYFVLISFREWLHSYEKSNYADITVNPAGSHLFQRVASFLLRTGMSNCRTFTFLVLISFREWLHSYKVLLLLNAQQKKWVLISFREWLHSYRMEEESKFEILNKGSHLFQRVASFLLIRRLKKMTKEQILVLISFREWLHSYQV